MPLRSPKMYFCIFGFQRLVWWPKCPPASSNSFIVNVAMSSPLVRLASDGERRDSPALPRARGAGDRSSTSCVLGRVLRVDSNVLLGQVGSPHPASTRPAPKANQKVD